MRKHTQSKKFTAMIIFVVVNLFSFILALVFCAIKPEISQSVSGITSTFIGSISFAISVYFGGQSAIDYKLQNNNTSISEDKKQTMVTEEIQKNLKLEYNK